MMRTVVHRVHGNGISFDQFAIQLLVEVNHVRFVAQPLGDRPLIGDENQKESCLFESNQGFDHSRQEVNARRIPQVTKIFDESAITVEEYCSVSQVELLAVDADESALLLET